MRIEKKWTVKNAPNVLSDNQMKHVVAGYGNGYGDGYGDGYSNSGGYRCCCGMGTNITCYDNKDNDWVIDNCPDGIGGCFLT